MAKNYKTLKGLNAIHEEIAESIEICVYISGNLALIYAANTIHAYDQRYQVIYISANTLI